MGRFFVHPSRPALWPTQPPIQWVPGLFRGVKRPVRGADHPPPSSAEVEGRVELYICSPSWPSWPVIGRTLPLPLTFLLLFVTFMQGIFNYVSETNHFTRVYIVAAIMWLQFLVHVILFPMINVLNFYVVTFRCMRVVPVWQGSRVV